MRAWYLPTWVNERDPGDVADRPDVLGGPQPLVDLDPTPADRSSPSASSPSTFGRRPVATQQPVERELRAVGEQQAAPRSTRSARASSRMSTPSSRSASSTSAAASASTRGRSRSSPWTSVTCEPTRGEELRELAADGAAAEHEQRRGHLERLGRLDVRPVVDLVEPRRSAGSPATSRSRSRAGRSASSCPATWTTRRVRDDGVAADELAALAGEPLDLGGVVALGDEVAPREDRPADRASPARAAGSAARRGHELRRPQHRLRRHARPVGALAADEAPLDERHLRSFGRAGGGRRRNARRTTLHRERRPAAQARWFAFRKAFATFAATCLSTSTALFIATIAVCVSFAETALTVLGELRAERRRDATS